jgi:hypothetical protein
MTLASEVALVRQHDTLVSEHLSAEACAGQIFRGPAL